MLYDKAFPEVTQHAAGLLTPDRDWDPMTEQSTGTTKVQLGEPVSLIGVIYRSIWVKGYLEKQE